MAFVTSPPAPWVVVSDYPAWPSPYFAQLELFAGPLLNLEFAPGLQDLAEQPAGVVNLHRLKRLYRDGDGARTTAAAHLMLNRLDALRDQGWKVVWTIHNLLPIDGTAGEAADAIASDGVLARADVLLTHTESDAAYLSGRPRVREVRLGGWGGLSGVPRINPDSQTRALAGWLRSNRPGYLTLGNMAEYKDLPGLARGFLAAAGPGQLLMAGPCPDPQLVRELRDLADCSDDRLTVHFGRIEPGQVHELYAAADYAVCPYRAGGRFAFFTSMLHPSSVATAVAFGTPVIAPDLPSIREITDGTARVLYDPAAGPAQAFAFPRQSARRRRGDPVGTRWAQVAAVYAELAEELLGPAYRAASVVNPSPYAARSATMNVGPAMPPTTADSARTDDVVTLLADAYGIHTSGLERLPIGQGTVNYRASAGHAAVFVKSYLPGTDLEAEEAGIGLSVLAGKSGVPTAQVLPAVGGKLIAAGGNTAISVWDYVDGHTLSGGLNRAQLAAAGSALGRIHRAFAELPASSGPAPQLTDWTAFDPADNQATIDRILAIIAERPNPDAFDIRAEQTLCERRTAIAQVPAIIAALPKLTTQVMHGDYSILNLMFDGDDLAAVVDFSPPDPFLISYELGRIAFDAGNVVNDPNWLDSACILITAYMQQNPDIQPDDIHQCARAWMIQLLTSLYGVKNHYLKPGLLQDDLDAFWLLRHAAAQKLLANSDQIEAQLRTLTTFLSAQDPASGGPA